MNPKLPKNQTFSLGAVKLIQELCKPLHKQALIHFTHDITHAHGQISMLMNDKQGLMFYFQNKMPAICTDESGNRTFPPGIYLGRVIKELYNEAAIIMPKLPFAQSSIHIYTHHDYPQLYSFYFDLGENDFLHWVVNNGHLLTDFIDHYNANAHDTVTEAIEPVNRTVLPLYSEIAHQLTETKKPLQIKIIHKDNKMPIYLAQQQSICLMLLAKGKTAKEIAHAMKLSHRTIEHYLERIRKLLGCNSNLELLAAYSEQLYLQGVK